MAAEQVQLTGKVPERSFQNTIQVPFGGSPGRFVQLTVQPFLFVGLVYNIANKLYMYICNEH